MLLPICPVGSSCAATGGQEADLQGQGHGDAMAQASACAHQLLGAACRGGVPGPASSSGPAPHSPRPFLMHAARVPEVPADTRPGSAAASTGCACVVVSMRMVARGPPGCWALVLSSLGAQPPYMLHNVTPCAISYREATGR